MPTASLEAISRAPNSDTSPSTKARSVCITFQLEGFKQIYCQVKRHCKSESGENLAKRQFNSRKEAAGHLWHVASPPPQALSATFERKLTSFEENTPRHVECQVTVSFGRHNLKLCYLVSVSVC